MTDALQNAFAPPTEEEAETLRSKTDRLAQALQGMVGMNGYVDAVDGEGAVWCAALPHGGMVRAYVWGVFNGLTSAEASWRALFPIYSTETTLEDAPHGVRLFVQGISGVFERARINIPVRDPDATPIYARVAV